MKTTPHTEEELKKSFKDFFFSHHDWLKIEDISEWWLTRLKEDRRYEVISFIFLWCCGFFAGFVIFSHSGSVSAKNSAVSPVQYTIEGDSVTSLRIEVTVDCVATLPQEVEIIFVDGKQYWGNANCRYINEAPDIFIPNEELK